MSFNNSVRSFQGVLAMYRSHLAQPVIGKLTNCRHMKFFDSYTVVTYDCEKCLRNLIGEGKKLFPEVLSSNPNIFDSQLSSPLTEIICPIKGNYDLMVED